MKIEIGSGAVLLTIVLVILKAYNKLDWDWIWIFSPIWISALIGLLVLIIFIIIAWSSTR